MTPTADPSLTTLLTSLGLGHYAAGIASLMALAGTILPQIMPFLSVPTAVSSGWYRVVYGVLARVTGNYHNNAPVTVYGAPAGGIVPVHEVQQPSVTGRALIDTLPSPQQAQKP
jgi:hypothetical protein